MTSSTSPYRARVMGTRHMAAAGHYLAAQSALQVLEAGGNAVDAGCAGGMALTVLQSEYVGFAGVAPMMIYLAERDEVVTIAGLGPWPKAASLDYFHREHDGAIPPGIMRTVVPAGPDAWITALERFGTMSFGEVAQFAIRFARDGFPAPRLMCDILAGYEDQFRRWPSSAAIYMPGGSCRSPASCSSRPISAARSNSWRTRKPRRRAPAGRRGWPRRGMPSTGATSARPSPAIMRKTAAG